MDDGQGSNLAQGPNFDVSVVSADGETIVAVRGEIDLSSAEELWSAVEQALNMSSRLVIDMTETTFMDSTALAVLARAYRELGQVPEAVVVRSPSPRARELLTICGLEQLITIQEGREGNPAPA